MLLFLFEFFGIVDLTFCFLMILFDLGDDFRVSRCDLEIGFFCLFWYELYLFFFCFGEEKEEELNKKKIF